MSGVGAQTKVGDTNGERSRLQWGRAHLSAETVTASVPFLKCIEEIIIAKCPTMLSLLPEHRLQISNTGH